MTRFSTPPWRILGSIGGWLVFAFSFTGLYLSSTVVLGLGGFCASGGPYVIETECPASVVVLAPLGVFGIFVALGLAFALARGFGTPLLGWWWPILFVGLGVAFLLSALEGNITGWIIAVLFVAMGVVPLVVGFRGAGLRPLLVGSRTVRGEAFGGAPMRLLPMPSGPMRAVPDLEAEPVSASVGDWALALGCLLLGAGGGVLLAVLAFAALARTG